MEISGKHYGGPGYDIPYYPSQQTGPGYDIPWYDLPMSPPSYSGRSGGPGYDIPCYPPQQTSPSYSGRSGGPGYDIPCYPPQQPAPRPFSSFVRDQRYHDGNSTAPPQQPRPRPFSSFGWDQRYACRDEPPVNGPANSIAQGQAQRDVRVDDRAEQQRPTTEIECHGGPVPEVSGPPEATASLARGGLPFISDSASEQWLQSDNMEMPMLSPSEGPQQSAPTAVTLAAAAPAAEAVTGTRVFPAVSPEGVAEAPASSAGAALAAVPAAAPATGGTVFPTASVGGAARAPASADGIAALTAAPATGGTVPFAASVGGANASSAVAAASAETSAVEPATIGNVPSAAPVRGVVEARESFTGAVSSDAATEAASSTGGTAAPAASTAREVRALASAAGSDGEICGERGASTHPFDPGTVCPLEVHHYNGSWLQHGSSNDNTSDHDSWWDATCVGALMRPFDPENYAGKVRGEQKRF